MIRTDQKSILLLVNELDLLFNLIKGSFVSNQFLKKLCFLGMQRSLFTQMSFEIIWISPEFSSG